MNRKLVPSLLIFVLLLVACTSDNAPTAGAGPTATGATGPGNANTQVPATAAVTAPPIATLVPHIEPTHAETHGSPEATPHATGSDAATPHATGTAGAYKQVRVALVVSGRLGDKSFWDSSKAGLDRAEKELGARTSVFEQPVTANWRSTLEQVASGDYDIIVVGGSDQVESLQEVAPLHSDKKFILFDATVDQQNVANVVYAQNEASFLAGALSACAANSPELQNLSGKKTLGAVGGMKIDVVDDFMIGYEQGAKYVDPEMTILTAFAGTWNDPAKGKQLANAQIQQGADVVFNVAGSTGLGALEAAAEARKYSIGADANQNGLYKGSVLSSVLKRVDNSIFDLIQMEATGSLQTGRTYPYGIQNNGVGLAEDELYKDTVPEQCQQQVEKAKQDIARKKVLVQTALK